MHALSDVVQYQVKLNFSELIGAGMELTQVQIAKFHYRLIRHACMALLDNGVDHNNSLSKLFCFHL